MNILSNLKKNNKGSTLVMVIVTVLFIGILGSLILGLAATGYRVRNIDYSSRTTFYENEEYTGRIYSEAGMAAVGILGDAYTDTMARINAATISSKEQLNNYLKKLYYKRMLIYYRLAEPAISETDLLNPIEITAPSAPLTVDPDSVHGQLNALLQTMANGKDDVSVDTPVDVNIYGKIKASIVDPVTGEYEPTIRVEDIHLSYVNKEKTYGSDITFDLVVGYPDWDFTFANPDVEASDLDTFVDYVFISNGMLSFENTGADAGGRNVSVSGCVSAGDNRAIADAKSVNSGLHIGSGIEASFGANANYMYDNFSIVVTDNIVLDSSATRAAEMEVTGGSIWCNSILLNRAASLESTVGSKFTATGTDVYLQDDLQLEGENSVAEVTGIEGSGSFYGYSYGTTEGSNTQNHSSAIILNGNNSKLTISGLNALSISGLAYLDFTTEGTNYRTGESLSVIGNQFIYLVPSECLPENYGNPHRKTNVAGVEEKIVDTIRQRVVDSSYFFGTSYLNPSDPIKVQEYTIDGKRYVFYYLNFSSVSSQTDYVKFVMGSGLVTAAIANTSLTELRKQIKENLAEFNMNATEFIKVATPENFYTTGAIVKTAKGGVEEGSESIFGPGKVTMAIKSATLSNRYKLLKSCLISVPSTELVDDFSQIVCNDMIKKYADGLVTKDYRDSLDNGSLSRSLIYNIVDWNMLRTYAASAGGVFEKTQSVSGGASGKIVYSDSSMTVSSGSGIYVIDGDAVVSSSFEGLVVASGKITVTGGSSYDANGKWVLELLKAAQDPDTATDGVGYSNVFTAFPVASAPAVTTTEINQVIYKDVVNIDNWRKY